MSLMVYWIVFAVFVLLFALSMLRERRAFRNAVLLACSLVALFLALAVYTNGTSLNTLLLLTAYVVFPLCLLLVSFVFVSAGILSIKREGFALSHGLSIAFGLGIWMTFFTVGVQLFDTKLPTIAADLLLLLNLIEGYILFTFIALFIYTQLYRLLPKNKRCDFVLIHGAGLLDGTRVSPLLAGRLNKGLAVWNASGRTAKIIVSGGQGDDEKLSEAAAMKSYLMEKGVAEESLLVEDRSTTTLENMQFSKKIMDGLATHYRVIFVTNDYHVFRTGTYAKKVGLRAEGVGCKTAFYYWPNAFIREYVAIMIHYKIVPIVLFLLWLTGSVLSLLPFNL